MGLSEDLGWWKARKDNVLYVLRSLYPEVEMSCTIEGGEADRELSSDLKVTFPDRVEVWALKFRRKEYYQKYDVTIEILNGDGTRGDWYKFAGGIVKKYVYGWFDNGNILELLVLNVAELMKIPVDSFDGPLEREFPGNLRIRCFQNEKHGRAFFTAIPANFKMPTFVNNNVGFQHFPEVIEKRWRPNQ